MSALPSHGECLPLAEVTSAIANGFTHQNNPASGGLPISRIQTISKGEIDFELVGYAGLRLAEVAKHVLNPGDILFSHINSKEHVGKVAIYKNGMPTLIHGMNLLRIVANDKVLPAYLFWAFRTDAVRSQIWANTRHAVNQASINIRNLSTVEIPVPPLDEQKRIVETLDEHLSRLDKALAETEYSAKATRRFSASLLHAMFSGDLMKDELGIQDINPVELATVADVQSGGTPKGLDRLTSEAESETHKVPFYKVGDMNRDARYMKSSRSYLTETVVDSLKIKVIPAGSVIFPKAGGAIATDKKRLVQVPGPIDLNCMAVIPGAKILPSYLAWFFDSFKLSDLSNGSILPQIGKTAVMQVRLPCPSLSEQETVVQYLEENISKVRAQVQSIEGVASSIATLRRSILNDAFSGRLVDRGSSEQ